MRQVLSSRNSRRNPFVDSVMAGIIAPVIVSRTIGSSVSQCPLWVKSSPEGSEIRPPLSPRSGHCLPAVFSLRHGSALCPCHGLDCTRQPRLATRRSRPRTRPGGSRTPAMTGYSAFAEWRLRWNRHFALATEVQGVLGVPGFTTGLGADPDGLRQINPTGRISLSSSGKSPSGVLPSCPRGRGVGHRHRTLGRDAVDAAASCARWDRRAG